MAHESRSLAMAALVAVATFSGLSFVQPQFPLQKESAPMPPAVDNLFEQDLDGLASKPEESSVTTKDFHSLVLGLSLGLIVGLASVGMPGTADAVFIQGKRGSVDTKRSSDYDIRKDGFNLKRIDEDAKKDFAKMWRKDGTWQNSKDYRTPSTGMGYYSSYGIDQASPLWKVIRDDGSGHYFFKKSEKAATDYIDPKAKAFWEKYCDMIAPGRKAKLAKRGSLDWVHQNEGPYAKQAQWSRGPPGSLGAPYAPRDDN